MKTRALIIYDEKFALALGRRHGQKRFTRKEVRLWAEGVLSSVMSEVLYEDEPSGAPEGGAP